MRRLAILVIFLASSATISSSEVDQYNYKVRVTNDYRSLDGPINASGTCMVDEKILADNSVVTKWTLDVSLTNTSSKEILAYELSIDLTSSHRTIMRHVQRTDYVFVPDSTIKGGATESLSLELPVTQVPHKTRPSISNSVATVRVLFVEFADGSKYGRTKWSDNLVADRKVTFDQLKSLSDAYRAGGEKALSANLAAAMGRQDNVQLSIAVLNRIKTKMDSQGSENAATDIQNMVNRSTRRAVM